MSLTTTSISFSLGEQLNRVKTDFLHKWGIDPEIRFSIGRGTLREMLSEREMLLKPWNAYYCGTLKQDQIEFHGALGRIVDGLSGFVIQVLNEPS